jgi:hypothetical protein
LTMTVHLLRLNIAKTLVTPSAQKRVRRVVHKCQRTKVDRMISAVDHSGEQDGAQFLPE